MRLLTFILSLISFVALQAQKTSLTQRLHEVDRAIEESPRYVAQREARITEARRNYGAARQTAGKYEFALQLYELYKPFVSDSAIYFLREGIRLSDQLGDRSAAVYCRSLLAIRCANIGMYDEALCILDSINIEGVDTLTMGTYYAAYNNVYNELAYYTSRPHAFQLPRQSTGLRRADGEIPVAEKRDHPHAARATRSGRRKVGGCHENQ